MGIFSFFFKDFYGIFKDLYGFFKDFCGFEMDFEMDLPHDCWDLTGKTLDVVLDLKATACGLMGRTFTTAICCCNLLLQFLALSKSMVGMTSPAQNPLLDGGFWWAV